MRKETVIMSLLIFVNIVLVVGVYGALWDTEEILLSVAWDAQELRGELQRVSDNIKSLKSRIDEVERRIASVERKQAGIDGKIMSIKAGGWAGQEFTDWILGTAVMEEDVFKEQVGECEWDGKIINYPCIIHIRDFKHISDEAEDHLKSYREFIEDGEGDCEDYAGYFAALVRRAILEGKILRFYRNGSGTFTLLHDGTYYENANPLDLNIVAVQIVCGVEDENTSHCINRVKTAGGKLYWVEPQNGEILEESGLETYDIVITRDGVWWYGWRT